MTEQLYFESLPLKMSSFELESFDMTDVSIDQSGHIEVRPLLSSPLCHSPFIPDAFLLLLLYSSSTCRSFTRFFMVSRSCLRCKTPQDLRSQ